MKVKKKFNFLSKRTNLASNFHLKLYSYLLWFLIFLNNFSRLTTAYVGLPGMFSETLSNTFDSTLVNSIDSLLYNTSLSTRYESSGNCSTTLYSLIINNANYTRNSFESRNKYFQCEEIFELFCNPLIENKTIISHNLMDCEDFLETSNQTSVLTLANDMSALKIINLSPSSSQIAVSLMAILDAFSLKKYAIVYSAGFRSDFLQLASSIVYKISKMKPLYSLEFSLAINDVNLKSTLNSSFNTSSIKSKFSKFF